MAFIIFLISGTSIKAQDQPVSLTKDQMAWGETQLRQMLHDRPAMAPYVKEGDDLWNWTLRQFAGEAGMGEVQWDPSDPEPLWDAVSAGPDYENHKLAVIKVTKNFTQENYHKGEPKSGPMLWFSAFYELFNVQNSKRSLKIDDKAEKGLINRQAFVIEHSVIENDTIQEAHEFFQEVWIPNCKRLNLPYEDEQLIGRMGKGITVPYIEDLVDELLRPNNPRNKLLEDWYDKNYLSKYQKQQRLKKETEKSSDSIPSPP